MLAKMLRMLQNVAFDKAEMVKPQKNCCHSLRNWIVEKAEKRLRPETEKWQKNSCKTK